MANVGFRSWNIPRHMLPPPVFSFIFVSETARFSIRWLWILWGWLQVFNTVQRWVSKMRVSVHSVPLRPELPVATDVAVHYTKKWPVSSFLYPLPSLYLHKFWELKLKPRRILNRQSMLKLLRLWKFFSHIKFWFTR